MSGPTPRPPRRRIAGERRPARTDGPVVEQERTEPQDTAERAPERATDPVGPPSAPPPKEPRPPRDGGSGPSWLVVAVLGGLALVLVAAAAFVGLVVWSYGDVHRQDQVDAASRTAPAAAERASAAILSYGYQSLDADEKSAERYMTPAYRTQYARTFDRLVRPNAAKLRAKVEAEVKASGVTHADPDRVTVLLYVNQTTTSTANGGQPQIALNRVQLTMVHRGGSWLVDNITSY